MRLTRPLSLLGTAALTFFALALPAEAGPKKHGKTAGDFHPPAAGAAGDMKGALKNKSGKTVLRLVAKLSPPTATEPGKIVGVLTKKTPTGPKKVAEVHGQWKPASATDGGFHAVFTKSTATGPEKIGKMTGKFKIGPSGNGHYKGKWVIGK